MVAANSEAGSHEAGRSSTLTNAAACVSMGSFVLQPTQHELELDTIFPEIMQQASQEAFFAKLKSLGKVARLFSNIDQVAGQQLPPDLNFGQVGEFVPLASPFHKLLCGQMLIGKVHEAKEIFT